MDEPKWGIIVAARESDSWQPRQAAEQHVKKTGLLPVWIREENFDSQKFCELFRDSGYARTVWLLGDQRTAFLEHVIRIARERDIKVVAAYPELEALLGRSLAVA